MPQRITKNPFKTWYQKSCAKNVHKKGIISNAIRIKFTSTAIIVTKSLPKDKDRSFTNAVRYVMVIFVTYISRHVKKEVFI